MKASSEWGPGGGGRGAPPESFRRDVREDDVARLRASESAVRGP
jgi:hypothetical protein